MKLNDETTSLWYVHLASRNINWAIFLTNMVFIVNLATTPPIIFVI